MPGPAAEMQVKRMGQQHEKKAQSAACQTVDHGKSIAKGQSRQDNADQGYQNQLGQTDQIEAHNCHQIGQSQLHSRDAETDGN